MNDKQVFLDLERGTRRVSSPCENKQKACSTDDRQKEGKEKCVWVLCVVLLQISVDDDHSRGPFCGAIAQEGMEGMEEFDGGEEGVKGSRVIEDMRGGERGRCGGRGKIRMF